MQMINSQDLYDRAPENLNHKKIENLNILYIVEADIATTHIIEGLLGYCSKWGLKYTKIYLKDLSLADLSNNNLPLFIRSADPLNTFFVEVLSRFGKPYIYYLDDNFWALTGDSSLAQYYSDPCVRKSLENLVCGAELVLVNSDILAEVVAKFNKQTVCVNAFFDFSLISDLALEPHDELRIGFAGSSTREGDFEIVVPAIRRVIEEYGDRIVFEFAGMLPQGLREGKQIKYFPANNNYSDFVKWQYLRNWDIALAPLAPVESNLSKTNNKYREYGACGVPGIYSSYGPYLSSVTNGKTGLFAGWNEEDWYRSLCFLIENEVLRKKISDGAYRDVKMKYSLDSVADQWATAFYSVDSCSIDCSTWALWHSLDRYKYKIVSVVDRAFIYYKTNGILMTFCKVFTKLFQCSLKLIT